MGRCWRDDKGWSDRFAPHIRCILGDLFFKAADDFEDQKHNTDFDMVFRSSDGVRVAARMRKQSGRWERYLLAGEFTVRSTRPSGVDTELQKIRAGWGDFMFYGFAHEEGDHISNWVVLNLDGLRGELAAGLEPRHRNKPNPDGSSTFNVYSTRDLRWSHTLHAAFEWPALTPRQTEAARRPDVVTVTRIENRARLWRKA